MLSEASRHDLRAVSHFNVRKVTKHWEIELFRDISFHDKCLDKIEYAEQKNDCIERKKFIVDNFSGIMSALIASNRI